MRLIYILSAVIAGLVISLFVIKPENSTATESLKEAEVTIDRPGHIKSFINKYCSDCHDEDIQKGGIDLTALEADFTSVNEEVLWTKVIDQVSSGSMPPKKKKKQPAQEERSQFSDILADHLSDRIKTRQDAIGRTVIRRLTREEYENTLRDLLDLPDLEVKEFLPADQKSHGFDNVAHSQSLSHVQIARYLEAADFALDCAINPQPKPELRVLDKKATEIRRFQITDDRKTIGDKVYLIRQPNSAQTPWKLDGFDAHFSGTYKIKMWTYATHLKKDKETPIDDQHVLMFFANPSNKVLRPKGNLDIPANKCEKPVEIVMDLHAGEKPLFQIATIGGRPVGPSVVVERVLMEGPILASWPPAGHKLLFGDLKSVHWEKTMSMNPPLKRHLNYKGVRGLKQRISDKWMVVSENPEADARSLLLNFMSKAFRRPVDPAEVDDYLILVTSRLKDNYCFHDAMKTGYKAILCSPDFLYLNENHGVLDDYALASRLSYFIWKSMPDEQLMELAAQGKLKNNIVLKNQTERMIQDSKSQRFVHSFIDQWLELEDINLTFPDSNLYPEFNDWLLDSMSRETYSFFNKLIKDNLGATQLVDSDFLMLNQRLADLYEIQGVKGDEIRPVNIPKDSVRGGLLTQSSILKITANGTTTSPVIRGAWITENIMGKHIPPPPPNAGSVEPDTRGATTIRELLDKHRNNESCAGCHKRIDPAGFALESFDPMGGFRTKYRSMEKGEKVEKKVFGEQVRFKNGLDVDCSGQTEEGAPFNNVNEFRALLLKDESSLAKNITKKLLVFSTGAQVHFTDRQTINEIVSSSAAEGYGIKSIIHGIVQSRIFRRK